MPSVYIEALDIFDGRSISPEFDCYNEVGDPLVIAVDDQVRFKVWSVDDATPEIEASLATTNSKVQIVDYGVVNTTPARVRCVFHQTDTAALVATTQYRFELLLIDHSDADKAKVMARGDVIVSGSPGGSIAP